MKNKVICKICNKEYVFINTSHLKKHNISKESYIKLYGNDLISENHKNKLSVFAKKSSEIMKNKSQQEKEKIYKKISITKKEKYKIGKTVNFRKGKKIAKRLKINCTVCNAIIEITENNWNKRFSKQKFIFCNNCRKEYKGKGIYHSRYGKEITEKQKQVFTNSRKNLKGKNNPMFGKKTKTSIGYRSDLKHICRSSWEANVCRILKHKKIDYEYEPKQFKIDQNSFYTPDLYIKKYNLYVEIKGYMNEKSLYKIKKFKESYPKLNFFILDEKIYNNLKQIYSKVIEWEHYSLFNRKKIKHKINFVKIDEIKISSYSPKFVYNISVEEDESYIANGIVTHNTKPHEIKPKNKKALAFEMGGNNVVVKKVKHPGTKGTHFVDKILDDPKRWKKISSVIGEKQIDVIVDKTFK